ncbi:hypothetical protein [Winogradskyella tangerina]|uniref:hypothetical protein n=1 Tax=Winogradskyella tangerina TaxID=2023240 RepID=UPI000DBE7903|nr:hypothetical protein [Winogradskyella tangerina]
MKTLYKLVVTVVLVICSTSLYAQQTLTDFTAIDESGEDNNYVFTTFTKQGNTLLWKQNNYTSEKEVSISLSTIGDYWDQNTQTGSITLTGSLNDYVLNLKIVGTSEGISAEIQITNPTSEADPQIINYSIETLTLN